MPSVALPADDASSGAVNSAAADVSQAPGRADAVSGKLTLSVQQRAYLNALPAAGVDPSDDLMALRIGSYICQAKSAGQSDQAIWDFVQPLVASDVEDADVVISPVGPTEAQIDAATHRYIRIATEQLC